MSRAVGAGCRLPVPSSRENRSPSAFSKAEGSERIRDGWIKQLSDSVSLRSEISSSERIRDGGTKKPRRCARMYAAAQEVKEGTGTCKASFPGKIPINYKQLRSYRQRRLGGLVGAGSGGDRYGLPGSRHGRHGAPTRSVFRPEGENPSFRLPPAHPLRLNCARPHAYPHGGTGTIMALWMPGLIRGRLLWQCCFGTSPRHGGVLPPAQGQLFPHHARAAPWQRCLTLPNTF